MIERMVIIMERTLFRTKDIFKVGGDAQKAILHYANLAKKSGLTIIELDNEHFTMVGYKLNFLKYYVWSAPVSVKHGQKLSAELKRIIDVLFWT